MGFTWQYDPCLEMSICFYNLFICSRLSWPLGLCLATKKILISVQWPIHLPAWHEVCGAQVKSCLQPTQSKRNSDGENLERIQLNGKRLRNGTSIREKNPWRRKRCFLTLKNENLKLLPLRLCSGNEYNTYRKSNDGLNVKDTPTGKT